MRSVGRFCSSRGIHYQSKGRLDAVVCHCVSKVGHMCGMDYSSQKGFM